MRLILSFAGVLWFIKNRKNEKKKKSVWWTYFKHKLKNQKNKYLCFLNILKYVKSGLFSLFMVCLLIINLNENLNWNQ